MLEDDEYWNASAVGKTATLDFFSAEDEGGVEQEVFSEFDTESGAELITLKGSAYLEPKNVKSGLNRVESESYSLPRSMPVASTTLNSTLAPTTSQSMSASSTPSKRPQVRLVVPRSLAAEYTSAVRKAVATKSGDQKALELERCERLLQMYVRSYIAASPLPKVTFSPDEVIGKLTSGGKRGEEAVLEVFRSERQKRALLERACQSLNGLCITRVSLFLYRTLSDDIFKEIMINHPDAVQHLVSYFKSMNDYVNLEKIYKIMDRQRDMFYLLLKKANNESVPETKLWALQTIKSRICSRDVENKLKIGGVTAFELEMLSEQIMLTESQIKMQQINEGMVKKKTNQILAAQPPQRPVTGESLLSTIHHCEFYHPNVRHSVQTSTGSNSNDVVLDSSVYKSRFKLTEMEFQWPVVRVLASRRQWDKIEQLMVTKGFLSSAASSFMGGVTGGATGQLSGGLGKGSYCAIGFDNMAQLLAESQAPSDIVSKYLMCIKDQHARLTQAGILDCKLAAVMTHIENRDKLSLEAISSRLAPGSKEMREAVRALEDRSIKWKR